MTDASVLSNDCLHHDVKTFFDEFVDAFRSFDGAVIAHRYAAPYLAMGEDGAPQVLLSPEAIAKYFQHVIDDYSAKGCCACCYRALEVVALGPRAALGTVTWELLREDGSVLACWRESYNLLRTPGGLKVFASVDHGL